MPPVSTRRPTWRGCSRRPSRPSKGGRRPSWTARSRWDARCPAEMLVYNAGVLVNCRRRCIKSNAELSCIAVSSMTTDTSTKSPRSLVNFKLLPHCLLYRAAGSTPQAVVAMDTPLFGPVLDLPVEKPVRDWILYPPRLVWKVGEVGEQQGPGEWWRQGRWRS